MASDTLLAVRPIGRVVRGRPRDAAEDRWEDVESEIEIDPAWADALEGIDDFSHLWVVWWLDASAGAPVPVRVHPQRRADLPLVGLFATRSPRRPNPIAITVVRLLSRQGGTLRVAGLDAFEESPILDLKPYLRRGDRIDGSCHPEWAERLWQESHKT